MEVVKELLKDNRVNPSARAKYAIKQAKENGHLEIVEELLKYDRSHSRSFLSIIKLLKKS